MISPAQRLRGFAALVSMLLLAIGVPWALVVWGGNPFGGSGLSLSRLSEPLGTEALLSVLVLVMWLAWLHFVVSLVLEFKGSRRGGPDWTPATSHPLTRRLVASVLLLVGSVTVTVPAAQAAQMPGQSSISVSRVIADGQGVADLAAQEMDARTALAETATSGDVKRELSLSYKVRPPHARHHDSLWDIAERMLGDGRRWTELYDLNKDRVQDDGTNLRDADLIYPGWELLMPDDATGPDVRGARPSTQAPDDGASDGAAGSQESRNPARPESFEDATASRGAGSADSTIDASLTAPLGTFGGLVAAGLLLGLKRRRQWNGGGGPGRGTTVEDEMSLHLAADTPRAGFVDRAMRHLGTHLDQRRPSTPLPHSCRAGSGSLSVSFANVPEQTPPLGWRVLGDGRVWAVDRDDVDAAATDVESPFPHLVTVGSDSGEQILLNLDSAGSPIAVGGDVDRIRGLMRSVVVDLATHAWADDLCVLVIGLEDDLGALDSPRLRQVRDVPAMGSVVETLDSSLPIAVVVAQTLSDADLLALVGWMRDRSGTTSVLHLARPDQARQLELETSGRLTSRSLGLFAEAVDVSSVALTKLMALYAAEPRRTAPSVTASVAGFASRLLDPTARTTASVRLLGPLDVLGSGQVAPERLAIVREMVVYLALHPEGVHPNVLAAAIWPRGVQDDVFESTMSHVARFLDEAARETDDEPRRSVLVHGDDGRWMLDQSEVRIDWQVFRAHLALAAENSAPFRHLDEALDLVAGVPLGNLDAGRYGWLAGSSIEGDINVAVVHAAEQLSDLSVERGDVHAARNALRRGLVGVPACEQLWQRLVRLSADDGAELRRVANEMYATIARHGSPLGATAETDALVHELAPDYQIPQRGRSLTA